MEKIHILDKLHSSTTYSAVGHEFNIDESKIYIKLYVFKQRHMKQGHVLIFC